MLHAIKSYIIKNFGTHRGAIRLFLSQVNYLLGRYKAYVAIDFAAVKRIIFVCQGNICRSPYCEIYAKKIIKDIPILSCGLDHDSGKPAFSTAISVSQKRNIDLTDHKTTALKDIQIKEGDLLVAMEDRHLAQIDSYIQDRQAQVTLLGLWIEPIALPLIYDPHTLSDTYFETCYDRIENALQSLKAKFLEAE